MFAGGPFIRHSLLGTNSFDMTRPSSFAVTFRGSRAPSDLIEDIFQAAPELLPRPLDFYFVPGQWTRLPSPRRQPWGTLLCGSCPTADAVG